MDLQKIATYGSAAAVVSTGAVVGGISAVDNASGGPEKRMQAEATELRQIVKEEVRAALLEAWPQSTGPVIGTPPPKKDYRQNTPSR